MKFKVSVEKMMLCSGFVLVDAKDAKTADEATALVQKRIFHGELQTSAVEWDDPEYAPEYADGSFCPTGDVDILT